MPEINGGNGVSKTWLIGALFTLVVLVGGSLWASLAGDVRRIDGKQQATEAAVQGTRQDLEVIKEKVKRLEDDMREIKAEQKDQSRKLDELLRRVR